MDFDNENFMNVAFDYAVEALNNGEVPIGCVFVYENNIIGSGRNEVNISKNATRHAEIVALEKVFKWCLDNNKELIDVLKETTLYVTVEPCIMCAAAVCLELPVPIKKIYYCAANDRFGGCESVLSIWKCFDQENNTVKTDEVTEKRAIDLLKQFYDQNNPNTATTLTDVKNGGVDNDIRLNGKLHVILTGTKRDCKVCSNRTKYGSRHETTYFCDTCPDKPRMHLGDCFLKYHTRKHYKA